MNTLKYGVIFLAAVILSYIFGDSLSVQSIYATLVAYFN